MTSVTQSLVSGELLSIGLKQDLVLHVSLLRSGSSAESPIVQFRSLLAVSMMGK